MNNEVTEEDYLEPENISTDLMQRITDTTNRLLAVRQRINSAEANLAGLKKEEDTLAHSVLPSLLDEAHVKDMTLDNNLRLIRKEDVYASIAKDRLVAAANWLQSHGYGAIVKSLIAVQFEKGDTKLAIETRKALSTAGISYQESFSIHPQTLRAFVREAIEQGRPLPDTINYHTQTTVDVKLLKEHA